MQTRVTSAERSIIVDKAITQIARGTQGTVAIVANPDDEKLYMVLNRQRFPVVEFRITLSYEGHHCTYDLENSIPFLLVLRQVKEGSQKQDWFVMLNACNEYMLSSADESVIMDVIALAKTKSDSTPFFVVSSHFHTGIPSHNGNGIGIVAFSNEPRMQHLLLSPLYYPNMSAPALYPSLKEESFPVNSVPDFSDEDTLTADLKEEVGHDEH